MNNKIPAKVTGSTDSIDNHPITRTEPSDIDFILDEWEKRSRIKTNLSRDDIKKIIIKVADFEYVLNLPVKNITNETIPLVMQVSPGLFDPRIPKGVKQD